MCLICCVVCWFFLGVGMSVDGILFFVLGENNSYNSRVF